MRFTVAWALAVLAIVTLAGRASAGPSTVELAATDATKVVTLIAPGSPAVMMPGLLNTTTPTFSWTPATDAIGYAIWVGDVSGGSDAVYAAYTPDDAGCASGTCSVRLDSALTNGSTYAWYVLTFAAA